MTTRSIRCSIDRYLSKTEEIQAMRSFIDESGQSWRVAAREEETPRHHGRWHLVFLPAGAEAGSELPLPEVQWQTAETARRTILTMSEVELRRRLKVARARTPYLATSSPNAAV
jgi:hypothetical protein